MSANEHTYECRVTWERQRQGRAEAQGRQPIGVGAPPEFQGTDDVWSPEHLTTAAVNACVMLTFLAIAANSKVPVTAYESTATATLAKEEGRGMVITAVTVRPHITIPAGVDATKVGRVLQMAQKSCYVSNSLTATVTLEPQIVTAA
jgi:organic hydroperoxide reductase OsmC/OhrA